MKAAVLYNKGEAPKYVVDFPEPIAGEDEVILSVKVAAVKNLDKSIASGAHYSAKDGVQQPKVIGGDGVGVLPDGQRVYALGTSGMIAEKAVVNKNRMVAVPADLDDVTAAALPNAVIGSAMAMRFRAAMQPGETVLINGATGVTGSVAVQLAKNYGAKKVIATGRNVNALEALLDLGADEIIPITHDNSSFIENLIKSHHQTSVNVVIDYLWGSTAENILEALKGRSSSDGIRFISVGAMSGDAIQLSSSILRGVDIQISGSGLGTWTRQQIQILLSQMIPDAFDLAAKNKLKVDTEVMPLAQIEGAWNMKLPGGRRLVMSID